eukprot:g582.t1
MLRVGAALQGRASAENQRHGFKAKKKKRHPDQPRDTIYESLSRTRSIDGSFRHKNRNSLTSTGTRRTTETGFKVKNIVDKIDTLSYENIDMTDDEDLNAQYIDPPETFADPHIQNQNTFKIVEDPNVSFQQKIARHLIMKKKEFTICIEGTNVIDPHGSFRIVWDIFVGILIVYSVIDVPMKIGFDLSNEGIAFWVNVAIDIIFGIDIILNFLTGYEAEDDKGGTMISDYKMIARHYFSFWFHIDFVSTVPIDLIVQQAILGGSGGEEFRFTKIVRVIRLVRLAKLVRVMKLENIFENIEDYITLNPAALRLIKTLVQMIFGAHLLACGLGLVSLFEEDYWTWMTGAGVQDADFHTRYITALYWTIATMTAVGYGDVVGRSTAERLWSICTQLVGASVFGFIIGNIAQIITDFDKTAANYKAKMDEVKEYIRNRKLPKPLARRLKAYFDYYLTHKSVFDEDTILYELSDSLRRDLVLANNRDTINSFEYLRSRCRTSKSRIYVERICSCLSPTFAVEKEFVCHEKEVGRRIFFLVKGIVEHALVSKDLTVGYYTAGSFFGAVGPIVGTRRPLSYRALQRSDLLCIQYEELDEILIDYDRERDFLEKLCERRMTRLFKTLVVLMRKQANGNMSGRSYLQNGSVASKETLLPELKQILFKDDPITFRVRRKSIASNAIPEEGVFSKRTQVMPMDEQKEPSKIDSFAEDVIES